MWVLHLVFVLTNWNGEGELPSFDRYLSFPTQQECREAQLEWGLRYSDPEARLPDVPEGYSLLMPPLECRPSSLRRPIT